ncbi:biotin transporter BioY [Candidatus Woesearchaeota archaeon]|nr:biotin transporter BioY [Candidatus Woesearchaeota archaeon]
METVNELKYKTIYGLIFKQKNIFIDLCLMSFSVVFLAILANIKIPLWPVPITMQTFGIFLIAFFFGSRKGLLTILIYTVAGLLGFGVFTGYKSGMIAVLGPTGGYIIGFLFMAFFVGKMIEKGHGRTKKSVLIVMLTGNLILYGFGLTGLWIFLGDVSLWTVLMAGLVPFIVGDVLKIIAAMAFFPWVWDISQKISPTED